MLPNNQKFYRPYEPYTRPEEKTPKFVPFESDDDETLASDTDSGSVTTTTSSLEHLPDTVLFATNLQLNEAGGQNFPSNESQLQFGINDLRRNDNYAPFNRAFNIDLPFDDKNFDVSGSKIWPGAEVTKQSVTSIVMLNSKDRDRSVYPLPSALTLRLPRTYLNVTSMQVIQMKLLSSFYYFRPAKGNTCMTINEFGRIFYNFLNQPKGALNVQKCIREGSYNINTLIAELNIQLNTPPLFYDYPGGFNQFVPLFVSTGDFSIAFNYPGDFFYDSLTRTYVAAPTRTYITTRFWQTTTLGFTPNLKQTKVAYYYPVLREFVLDPDPQYGIDDLNTNIDTSYLLPNETIYTRIVYAFQGVNDPIIQEMIDANVLKLDEYRSLHTFRNSLINRYVVNYETFNNKIYITSPSLNTSLVNLLNTQYAIFFAQQLTNYGLSQAQYNAIVAVNAALLSIINAMYDYIQTQLAIYFGINFNTFAPVYFTGLNNYINIQNAQNAIGVSSNYDLAVITNPNNPYTSNIIEQNREDPTVFWPNMSNLSLTPGLGLLGYPTNLGLTNAAPYLGGSNFPYEIATNNFNFSNSFIDADGDVYIDIRRKAGDIICPLQAARYTVFRFRSLYRQTLQVETMPRPTQYRYPAYNAVTYGIDIQTVFDNSYSFVFNSSNAKMDNVPFNTLSQIYGYSNSNVSITTNFGCNFAQSQSFWGSNTIGLNVGSNLFSFVFYLPLPSSPPSTGPAYKHDMALSVVNYPSSSPLPSALKLFLYQDRAAFMADLSGNARNENELHYKEMIDIAANSSSGTLTWTAYAGQTYYAILRSASISFQTLLCQLVPWYPNGTTVSVLDNSLVGFDPYANPNCNLGNYNYAQVNDPDFIKLPTSSNLWGYNPLGNEVNKGLVISNVPIGYDTNDVSTDLTDYIGYVSGSSSNNINPQALIRCDPTSGYFFQAQSSYSTSNQSYLYPGASNFILTPGTQSNYTPSNVPYRQFKIVNYYDTTYIPDPTGFVSPLVPADLSPNISAYTLQSTSNIPISNYEYDSISGNIQLGLGCAGFSFVPSDGIWNVDKIMFRSAIISPSDPNDNIRYLGVFLTSQVNTTPTFRLALSNAVAKLDFSSKIPYSSAGSVNFGFDSLLGTYYEFNKDTTFTQSPIDGFSQNAGVLTNNVNDFYSVVAFDSASNITYMRALTGSLTAYPYVTDASASRFYFDGNSAPNRRGIVMPRSPPPSGSPFGPPAGTSYTLAAYEQSIPIGTQILHYLAPKDIIQDLSGFIPWNGPGYAPSGIYADVSGVMMMQSTDFKFYSYPYNTTTRSFTYLFNLTVDTIFPPAEATTLVGAAGNSTSYAFLGFKVVGAAYQVVIKVYNVALGVLNDLFVPATFQIPDLGFSVSSFSLNDNNGFTIGGSSGGVATVYRTPNLAAVAWFVDTFAGYVSVQAVQPPSSSKIYFLPLDVTGNSSSVFYRVLDSLSSVAPNLFTISIVPETTTPTTFSRLAVTTLPVLGDEIFFLTQQNLGAALLNSTARYYRVKALTSTGATTLNAKVEYSDLVFRTAPPALNVIAPQSLVGGALGSKWAYFNQNYYIWGNRNDQEDAPTLVQNAWQIFYPTIKVVFRKLANAVNPIIDLSGLQYPEFPHTQMFVYNTKQAYIKDISNSTNPKWGFESSGGLLPVNTFNLNSNGFLVSDVNFSGFYFNSYIFNVPLLPNTNTSTLGSNPEPYYYLVVRNYTPSEKSQVLLRFNMPQRYDFGFVRLRDLSNEIIDGSNNPINFNPQYLTALSNFNSNFVFSNVNFGYNPTQNIAGSNITSRSFGDFLNQYIRLYNIYSSNAVIINQITSNVNSNMQNFINSNLIYILPSYALTRQNFTESITFSILWRSALTPTFLKLEDDWGLGYNLGYAKADTPYATVQRAESFFKILDDYIYLKLNTEYDMNRLDFGGKENLKETTEPTGNILSYNGKLLLNTFGSYAQTIIQNPVYFNPPLLKLDKLSFTWFDTAGVQIDNAECEWNAAIQFVEEIPKVNLRGKNPVIIPR